MCLKETFRIRKFLQDVYMKSPSITELETIRFKQVLGQLKIMVEHLKSLFRFDDAFRKVILMQINDCIETIKSFLEDPISIFPNLTLWFICAGRYEGVGTIRACDVIWSNNVQERGAICSKMTYMNVKALHSKVSENIARVRVFAWLGLTEETDCIFPELAEDYKEASDFINEQNNLPTMLFFDSKGFKFLILILKSKNI